MLIVWNLWTAPIMVMLDGVSQCTVESVTACRVNGVPAGHHTLKMRAGGRYESWVREGPIDMQWEGIYKFCWLPIRLIPEACDRWYKDQESREPPDVNTEQVTYKSR